MRDANGRYVKDPFEATPSERLILRLVREELAEDEGVLLSSAIRRVAANCGLSNATVFNVWAKAHAKPTVIAA